MDSVEATLELHGLKMELIQKEMKGFKMKVDRLEVKNREILGDLGKLDKKVSEKGISASSLSQTIKIFFIAIYKRFCCSRPLKYNTCHTNRLLG